MGKPSVPVGEGGVQSGDHLVGVDGIPVPDSDHGAGVVFARGHARSGTEADC